MSRYFRISLPAFFSILLSVAVFLDFPGLFLILLALSNLIFNRWWGEFKEEEIQDLVQVFGTRTFQWVKVVNATILISSVVFSFLYWDLQPHTALENLIFLLAIGVHTSCFVVTLAHEFVHGNSRLDRFVSAVLLLISGVPHFVNEHKFGHHFLVGMETDSTTPNKRTSFYSFFVSSMFNKLVFSFSKFRHKNRTWKEKMKRYQIVMYVLFSVIVICIYVFSNNPHQFVFLFLGQCLIANIFYELINYIQHYGLRRKEIKEGIHSRLAWNNYYKFTNYILYLLPLHSLHHIDYKVGTKDLWKAGPAMPHVYFIMVSLALIPTLWFQAMDPLVDRINNSTSSNL